MFSIHGMMIIPTDSQLQVGTPSGSSTGKFLNFKAVTQGKPTGNAATYQYWDMAMWVPDNKVDHWKDQLQPGHIFFVEYGIVTTYPVQDGKYHNTKVRLDHNKLKRLLKPMWVKDEE
jgi:hypothetical protein